MEALSHEIISKAVEILAIDSLTEAETHARLLALADDEISALRLFDVLPEAFGLALVAHVASPGRLNFAKTFSAKDASGRWIEIPLEKEPLFAAAAEIALQMFHEGPRYLFEPTATRSATVGMVNKALHAGENLDGATLGPLALIGIPAEAYLQ